ncbi:MAG TPA: proteasome accessory factor PafA2 family protein, partial [Verrucomicrobiae bacterium]|nr:proteasome accessory factor PafA2 family protein [Verrucomicrobiae bacterium]
QSVDTMQRRPIVNTRDEPHANAQRFRRFHVIIGDANMSPFATRLKVGTMALVLEALVAEPKRKFPKLADPLGALVSISRDTTFQWLVSLNGGQAASAIDIQREYLQAVKERCPLDSPERALLVRDWEETLDDLSRDIMLCRNRLDWVAKWAMIREFQEARNIPAEDPWLQSLDLEYSRLDFTEGLYYSLEQSGSILPGVPADLAEEAMRNPPPSTRAYIRGKCIQKFSSAVLAAQWDHITLEGEAGPIKISLLDLFAPQEIMHYARAVDAAQKPDDLRVLVSLPR